MSLTPQEIAAAFGVPVQVLQTVMQTGMRQVQLDGLFNLIQHGRQLDSQLTAAEQAEIDAVMAPIMERRSRRANYLAALEAHWSESKQSPNGAVNVPSQEEIENTLNEVQPEE